MEKFTKYKVAAINVEPVMYHKEDNLKEQYALCEEAAQNGAKLIALPEMANTGYCWYDRAEAKSFVEPIPGPTTDLYAKLCKEYGCYIVTGLAEVDLKTDIYYNSSVLIGPEGVIGTHRKTHPYISEPKWSKQGDLGHQVFDTPIGKIGILICMDIHFIETARLEALAGADIIVHTSNWLAEKTPAPYWLSRAFDNGCYVLEANRTGLERTVQFSGGSVLINPDGTIASYVDTEKIMYAEVALDKARNKKLKYGGDKIADRRPEMYMEIVHDTYLWNPLDFFGLYGYDPLPEGKKSRVAVVQMASVPADKQENLRTLLEYTETAAASGAELIVFPELTLTGLVGADEANSLAEPVCGGSADKIIDLCMKLHVYVVYGMIEQDGGSLYNTAVLAGPCGICGKYRKVHLSPSDRLWAAAGEQGFVHFNIPCGRVGLMIGYDAYFPESGRILALRGCDIICCPSAVAEPEPYGLSSTENWQNYPIPMGYSAVHWHLWRTRGGENNCYMLFSNQICKFNDEVNCFGRSGVFGPDTFKFPRTETILSKDSAEIGYLDITTENLSGTPYPTNVVRRKDLVCMRQPLQYDLIVTKKS